MLWQDDDFLLLVELGGALGDLSLVLGGSPSLLEEPSASPEEWEDSCSSLLGLLGCGFSSEGGDLVSLLFESGKFLTIEQETVCWRTREYLVH